MMRDSLAPRGGFVLVKSPNVRQQAARRRAMTAAAVLALATVSGLVGALARPHAEAIGKPHTGPFSYF
jgi:hypothetical protein